MLHVELFEDVRLELAVLPDRPDDLLALFVRGRLDQVGKLGRVDAAELAERDLEPCGRDMGDERLDVLPVDHAPGANPLAKRPR